MEQSADELRAMAYPFLCALDDADIPEGARRVAAWIVRLSYGLGYSAAHIPRRKDLDTLANIGITHVGPAIEFLKEKRIIQDYPEQDLYEPLPKCWEWKVRSRSLLGTDGARAFAVDLAGARQRSGAQVDFGEKEQSFQPEPTLQQIIGQTNREEASSCSASSRPSSSAGTIQHPPEPGEASGRSSTNPPGNIGQGTAGRGRLSGAVIRELARRSIESAEKVTPEVTSPTPCWVKDATEVTPEVSSEPKRRQTGGQKLPLRELSSRTRASDDHLSNHLPIQSLKLSSGLSPDDQGPDEAWADDGCAAGRGRQMVRMDDELLGDIRRHLGEHMGGYTDGWRKAIALSRAGVAHALEAAKQKRDCDRPGGYMRTCFLNACQKAGIDVPPEIFGRKKVAA